MRGVLAAIILYSSLLQAQRPGATLEGLVQDSTGAVIPNATVVLKAIHESTPVLTTKTDAGGKFRIRSITPGTYEVTINREGFQPAEKAVDIISGKPTVITVVLPV